VNCVPNIMHGASSEISGVYSSVTYKAYTNVDEGSSLLGCYTLSTGKYWHL